MSNVVRCVLTDDTRLARRELLEEVEGDIVEGRLMTKVAIGSGTRITASRVFIQSMLVRANCVPIPTYRKSTFRIPMISSLCSAPHDKKDNDVKRSPSETMFMVLSSQTATSTEAESWFLLPFTRACFLTTLTFRTPQENHIVSVPFDTIEKNKKMFSIFCVSPGHLGTIQYLIPGWMTIVKLIKRVKNWQSPSRDPWSNCLINSRETTKGQINYYSGRQKDNSKTICGRGGYNIPKSP